MTFFSEMPETNIYIFQAPWTSRTWQSPHDLVFGPKKDKTEHILPKKIRSVNAL